MLRLCLARCALLPLLIGLTACGGGSPNSSPGGDGGRRMPDAGTSPDATDGDRSDGGDAGGGPGEDGGEGGPAPDGGDAGPTCKTECEPDDCGEFVSDGCGGHLVCPLECPEGQGCGLRRPDKCDFPPPEQCEPLTAAEACEGMCGAVPDGCSDVIVCTADNGGVSCGENQFCQNGSCEDQEVTCTPLTAAEACENKCGLVSDGCSDVIACDAENGGLVCGEGKRCDANPDSDTANSCIDLPPPSCTPRTAEAACEGTCGTVDDGCGNAIVCEEEGFGCTAPDTCGGGGMPGECGSGTVCEATPVETACAGKCGFVPDGCGAGYQCNGNNGGVTCDAGAGESCGGGGTPNQCGAPACEPRSQAVACADSGDNQSCGKVADGCGGLIDCGSCPSGEICGLGGANLCAAPQCQAIAVETACAGKCGSVPDGCGGSYSCDGSNGGVVCTGGEYCGANAANECGTPPVTCTPRTCADLGHTCGLASDGCGHVINCWPACNEDDSSCSGSCGESAACLSDESTGVQSCVSGSPACSGSLCDDLPTSCADDSPTRLTGTVRTPGREQDESWINQLPVPNALVYIPAEPTSALPDIFEGVDASDPLSCGRCEDEQLVAEGESVLAAAVTDYKGEFTLEGRIPVDTAFTLVVKVGKWRRVVEVPAGTAQACAGQTLDHTYTRLPSAPSDGLAGTHLPKIAVSTGYVDEMECVFRNMGVAESEFTVPSGGGRVHMYRSNGARMRGPSIHQCTGWGCGGHGTEAACNDGYSWCSWEAVPEDLSVSDGTLFADQATLNQYDLIVWDCEGEEDRHGSEAEARVASFVNAGGRVFASHYSYVWVENDPSLSSSSDWGSTSHADSDTGLLSMSSGDNQRDGANPVKSEMFRNWLDWQGALHGTTSDQLETPSEPQFTITDPRDRAGESVGPATDEWVYRTTSDGPRVQQLSFNTPYGADDDALCGRVAYSGFHVSDADNDDSNDYFPEVCSDGELSAQEKVLAFMLFDLSTCVSAGDPPQPPECTPQTAEDVCPAESDACGYLLDGCGGVVDCGGCGTGYYCEGTQCKPQECTPASCSSLGFNCGFHADGCGGIALDGQGEEGCGDCSSGQFCGLGGPGLCGTASCTPIDYATACQAGSCGLVSNGCGGTYDCGGCEEGEVCGGGGENQCGPGSCSPLSKADACADKDCGLVSDGCGDTYQCGSCTAPESCGGGGQGNVCGSPECTPYTMEEACDGLECGWVGDGCGGAIRCGSCPDGGVCGGSGPNLCGDSCTPTTCAAEGSECGAISDGCGGVLRCGQCESGETCGAESPNVCGSGFTCTPRDCAAAGAECGLTGDGCGGVLDCGVCTVDGESCGGAGVPNQCGTGTSGCNPLTCDDHGAECGAASDGCGGLLDCGGCEQGYTCERNTCEPLPPVLI